MNKLNHSLNLYWSWFLYFFLTGKFSNYTFSFNFSSIQSIYCWRFVYIPGTFGRAQPIPWCFFIKKLVCTEFVWIWCAILWRNKSTVHRRHTIRNNANLVEWELSIWMHRHHQWAAWVTNTGILSALQISRTQSKLRELNIQIELANCSIFFFAHRIRQNGQL